MTESMLRYDEARLTEALTALPSTARAMFAATCAERMLPVYRWFKRRTDYGDPAALELALEEVWRSFGGHVSKYLESRRELIEDLVPGEDDSWVDESAYAQNATAAVAYAIGALLTGSVSDAVAASYQPYEALDYRVTNRDDVDINAADAERSIVSDPLIQQELRRQRRDLETLSRASDSSEALLAASAHMRERARIEGRTVFDFALE